MPGDNFRPFTIAVPATTANLGPGFDCLGLALDIWNTVTVAPGASPSVTVTGEGAGTLPTTTRNLIYRSAVRASRHLGVDLPPLRLAACNAIPLTRGLGSSAAATVAGLMIANHVCGNALDEEGLLALATELEGHPDNAAPVIRGGICLAVDTPDGHSLLRSLPTPAGLMCALLIPQVTLSTKESRAVLPRRIPRSDAVFNVGRTSLLVRSLLLGEWADLDTATDDRLHQPHRASLLPAMPALFRAARGAGAYGVFLSGAGPSVVAFVSTEAAEGVAAAMQAEAVRQELPASSRVVAISAAGASIVEEA